MFLSILYSGESNRGIVGLSIIERKTLLDTYEHTIRKKVAAAKLYLSAVRRM